MGERFLAIGIFTTLVSTILYFTKLSNSGVSPNYQHAALAVMVMGALLTAWGGLIILKIRRDEG
jgi:hypothetical protein